MVKAAYDSVRAKTDKLCQLDTVTGGDGDHGTAIAQALKAISHAAETGTELKTMLGEMAFAAMGEACGSTSTLIGALFLGMGDGIDCDELDARAAATMFKSGLASVQEQTQADVGDKTIMDALIPAVAALDAKAAEGSSLKDSLAAGAEAAEAGAKATVQMQARFGRARNLGARSIGAQDPGATSMAYIWRAFAETV